MVLEATTGIILCHLTGGKGKKKKNNLEKHSWEKGAMLFPNSYLNLHEFYIKVIELSQTD